MKKLLTTGILLLLFTFLIGSIGSIHVNADEVEIDYEELIESHHSIMLLIDPISCEIIYANPAAIEFYGYEDILSMNIDDINTMTEEEITAEMALAASEERNYFIFTHILGDGTLKKVEVRSYPVEIDGNTYLFSIIADYSITAEHIQRDNLYKLLIYSLLGLAIIIMSTHVILRNRNHKKLKKEKASIDNILEATHAGSWEWNISEKWIKIDNRCKEILGYSSDELPQMDIKKVYPLIHPADLKKTFKTIKNLYKKEIEYATIEHRMKHKNGSWKWIQVRGKITAWNESGIPQVMTGIFIDITIQKEYEERINLFFDQSLSGFFFMMLDEPVVWNDSIDKNQTLEYVFDHQRITKVNSAYLEQYGYTLEEALGKTPRDSFTHDVEYGKGLWKQMFDQGSLHVRTDERRKDGSQIWVEGDYICMIDSSGRIIGHFGNQMDVTESVFRENDIQFLAEHDYLTDLNNRSFFFRSLESFIEEQKFPIGIMMFDVNGLKICNDAYGHDIGDLLLIKVSTMLNSIKTPESVIARIGGDEFGALFPNTTFDEMVQLSKHIKEDKDSLVVEGIHFTLSTGFELLKDEHHSLSDVMKTAENYMYRNKLYEGMSVRNHAIKAILSTLTDKFKIEKEHSENVSSICAKIGKALKLRQEAIYELELAGMFHDIGKISIPDDVLTKPDKLTFDEYQIMQTHTEIGYQILRAADEYSHLAEYALYHHERFDGMGYPRKLVGKKIPLFARIIAVADSYEAMTTDRPYRKALSVDYAIEEIKKCSGTQFDPDVAKAFVVKVMKQNWE
ncbi:MAG: PAS domain S-box protein [Firmicutes bacterium]|nr:PAS domain S-box protein [Bacillota bacterium]